MPSSTDPTGATRPSAEAALIEKIEELSFIRTLTDRLARVPDFASACRVLVDLVWEDGRADLAAYFSVDTQRRVCRLEAAAPARAGTDATAELDIRSEPFQTLLAQPEPVVVLDGPAPSCLTDGKTLDRSEPAGVVIGAVMRVRDAPTGVLLICAGGGKEDVEEARRLLAITATSAALALDVSRNDAREEFLAMLRHDINNPVTAALGSAELLAIHLEAVGDDRLLDYARSLVDSLEAVGDLVSNYLHMAAIDRGMPWLFLETLDLGDLVHDIVDRLTPTAGEKQLTIECLGACPAARVDRRQIGRVVSNLVSNAIKYTPAGGRIVVAMENTEEGTTLAIRDTGYGLAAEDLPRLFTKYARFHQDKGIPGTGLGLYISKAIVEAHGGRIEAVSEPGQGTTFTVWLPK